MPQNRYDDKLREANHLILDLTPANYLMRIEIALEIKNIAQDKPNIKILEIGSWEGDLSKYILKTNPLIKLDCLDISQEMLDLSKPLLSAYLDRINFICEDALKYLETTDIKYDIITSAWTLHNFTSDDRNKVIEKIYEKLSSSGKFILLDKIYPDIEEQEKINLLNLQLARYRYTSKDIEKEITAHEHQDYTDKYRMDEAYTIKLLKQIWFSNIQIKDRVERDVVLIAEK